MLFDFPRPLFQHLQQQRVPTERLGESKLHGGKLFRQAFADRCQILHNMLARGEEIRQQNYIGRAALHAKPSPGFDVGLGQFQERRLNDRIVPVRAERRGDVLEIRIRLGPAASVSN